MLLNDIGKSPDATFRKINQHLETNYGFKIAEDVSDKDLVAIMEQIEEEITELKIKGDDSKSSPEISKRLLVLEGIRTLREFALIQFQSPDLDHVVNGLADFVCDSFRISGTTHQDFEECVRDGMKHYRSSRYRFPDDMIEERVRQCAMSRLHGSPDQTEELIVQQPILGEAGSDSDSGEDGTSDDTYFDNVDESKWIKTDPKKAGMFKGKTKADLEHQKAALKAKDAKHPGEVSDADHEKMAQLNFAIRAKSKGGLEEADVWGSVGKRAGAMGGHGANVPKTKSAKHAMNVLDNPSLSLAKEPEEEKPKMVRDQSGRLVPDPWHAHQLELKKGRIHKEGKIMKENLVKNLRRLLETEVSQAEVMMAAKGFAQEMQEMIEKIGRLQNEDLPPVTDQMRETYGTESSSAFQTQIYGALQGVMDALYTAKNQVDDAVTNMASTGQVTAEVDMDKDIGGDEDMGDIDVNAELDADLDNLAGETDAEDEFGGAEEEEPLGREMKAESVQKLQRKVLEMQKLVSKAKKLKEAKK